MDLDLTNAGRGVWLVKVPKYMQRIFDSAEPDTDVGKLKVVKKKGVTKPKVTFTLNSDLAELDGQIIPTEHEFLLSGLTNQTLGVFSETIGTSENSVIPETKRLAIEGRVVQRAECRPCASSKYLTMKKELHKQSVLPQRTAKCLSRPVNNYKPVSKHRHQIEYERRKKADGKKCRSSRQQVQEMLFAAFEKHQYYTIKDLVRITHQPVTYLKDILKDVCNYTMKSPHKNMWELKREYRQYNEEDEDEEEENEKMEQ